MSEPHNGATLSQAVDAAACGQAVVDRAIAFSKSRREAGHDDQEVLYALSHAAAGLSMVPVALRYAENGDTEQKLALVFIALVLADLGGTLWSQHQSWGVEPDSLNAAQPFVAAATEADFVAAAADHPGSARLAEDLQLVADTFRRFALDRIAPLAEQIHRQDLDVPLDVIEGVAELGCFGLSIREEYGGFASGGADDYLAMVIATEELSKASLGAGGSLITRPEILARALEAGGTVAQKLRWLPQIAGGQTLCAVAVTEPDYGSDVASLKLAATPVDGGFVLDGTKTWCTFAGRANALMVLARTNPDPDVGHRGLSLLIVEKPSDEGHQFRHEAADGVLEGRAIPTLGYRGMHSYEVSFDNWFVPFENLIGGRDGLGRGFYLQMAGFENGRLQTTARAVGVMHRAYEVAHEYANERKVFAQPLASYQLTRVKLAKMAAVVAISRQYSYEVARLMSVGEGALEAAMAKAFSCKWAEWVTREALQIHGGMGYAEEYEVSRLFVDARVLSIFEGADETLCLKLIARRLLA
ncbi:MAG: acyl-CoA dehydrogenase family protein [Acidimicrobiales bacterium]